MFCTLLPSVLWRCWLGGRKGIRPVKNEWCGTGMGICLERDADLHMAQLMPLPLTVSCFSKIQIGFTFLVPAHPGSPGKRAIKRVCVCVLYSYWSCVNSLHLVHFNMPYEDRFLFKIVSETDALSTAQQPPFYGHYTNQPALAGTSS